MKKYRYRLLYYSAYIAAIFVALVAMIVFDNTFANTLETLCIFASLLGILNSIMSYISVDHNVIIERSIFRKRVIYWNEIERVIKLPTSKGKRVFVGIYGNNKKIFVSFWFRNYKDLIKSILDKSRTTNNLWIDPRVIEIVE